MTNRIFISMDVPEKNIVNLIAQGNEIYGLPNNIKWESKDKLHITLKFLGDVGENVLELLLRRFENIQFNKIETKFEKFSFFQKNGKLKILFAGLYENPAIFEFQKIIEEECELLGFQREKRKFHPHVTILRIKGKEDINRLSKLNNYDITGEEFTIKSFSILKSELKQSGSEYTVLKSFKLI